MAGPRTCWGDDLLGSLVRVDTLCINQENSEERSQQVRNMRRIYSRATEVFCWAESVSNPLAIEKLIRAAEPKIDQAPPYSSHDKEIIEDFFKQPYWSRVWIIQEVAVTPKVTVLLGTGDAEPHYNPSAKGLELGQQKGKMPYDVMSQGWDEVVAV